MAKKVALINMKGGVGKSTLATNLAWEFATSPWNKSVLVIDLDPQFNCSQYLLGASRMQGILDNDNPTVWNIFEQFTAIPGHSPKPLEPKDTPTRVFKSPNAGSIDLIPSRLELSQTLKNPAGKDQLLDQLVKSIEDKYDLIVIDCAPTESVLTAAAYHAADWILVPVRPEFLSTIGLPLLANSLAEFNARFPNAAPGLLGIVFNAISDYSPEELTSQSEVSGLASQHGWHVFRNEVPYSKSFPKGAREGSPIFWTSYARTTVKRDFAAFANELAGRMGLRV